ncbi:hypothetical protein FKM82_028851 [Ascaphus truei]
MKDQDGKPQYPQFTVALRIRPINEAELDEEAAIIAHKVGEQIRLRGSLNVCQCSRRGPKMQSSVGKIM